MKKFDKRLQIGEPNPSIEFPILSLKLDSHVTIPTIEGRPRTASILFAKNQRSLSKSLNSLL